ncbi:MAG: hypothetical protein COA32_10670 [Fluviicola sp.]|nr:MAG: hypothetical protein COA32_10670 [Fluviicola sp.]
MRSNLSFKLLLFLVVSVLLMNFSDNPPKDENQTSLLHEWQQLVYSNYACLNDTSLNVEAFRQGLHGFFELRAQEKISNEKFLTIVDFTQHSSKKRMYVIDMESFEIVYKSLCSHGKNTGGAEAKHFSNKVGSLQSSLGFYIAQEIYSGKFDLAMRLDGLEYCNYNARDRGIVVHGAKYANPEFMKKNDNVLGRSYGCPALPENQAENIITAIKGGSCFFIYAENKHYKKRSKILNNFDFLTRIFD